MVLPTEIRSSQAVPTERGLADRLELPECTILEMLESFAQLDESVRRGGLETALIRSRLYEIMQQVEAVLPESPQALDNWAEIRAEMFRTVLVSREAARRGAAGEWSGPGEPG